MSKRICITGIGVVCPLGSNMGLVWDRIMSGKSGIVSADAFVGKTKSGVLGLVPRDEFDFNHAMFAAHPSKVNPKNLSNFIKYALVATQEALEDANLLNINDPERVGVSIGNGLGALDIIEQKSFTYSELSVHDPNSVLRCYSPYFIPSALPSLASGNVSMYFGLKGPNRSINAACASGLYSIDDAASMIKNDDADIVVSGATESTISFLALAGFDAMTALSRKHNDTPSTASRPYDKSRDGFVLAEGAGILILEDMEHALKRGAKIYAEYLGSGMTADAHNISSPSGEGAVRAMRIALQKAKLKPDQIDYIGVHATSTPIGDKTEIESIRHVFGDKIPTLSAVKSSIGHMLAAASGVETALLIKTLDTGQIPPTINVQDPEDFVSDIDYVPDIGRKQDVKFALKNSFGFGGTNAASIFKKFDPADL
jgi:3-oxoacyl-[acyl-carrier-protein] synthase II